MALTSMIIGTASLLLGFCCVGAPWGIVSITLGVIGQRQIKESHGQQKGGGMATAGIVTGALALVLMLIWIVMLVTGWFDYDATFNNDSSDL